MPADEAPEVTSGEYDYELQGGEFDGQMSSAPPVEYPSYRYDRLTQTIGHYQLAGDGKTAPFTIDLAKTARLNAALREFDFGVALIATGPAVLAGAAVFGGPTLGGLALTGGVSGGYIGTLYDGATGQDITTGGTALMRLKVLWARWLVMALGNMSSRHWHRGSRPCSPRPQGRRPQ